MTRRTIAAIAVTISVLVVGCSRAPRPETEVAADGTATTVLGPDATPDTAPVSDAASGATDPGVTRPGAATGAGGTISGGGRAGPRGTAGGATGPTSTTPGGSAVAPSIPGLFDAKTNRVGITDTSITLCAHAALTYAAAFNTTEADLNVYWTAINEAGGIFGRKVNAYYQNDNYTSDTAIQAATTCRDTYHPFSILGGIGFDQIPGVRDWAEKNHELYIHHTATENGANNLKYSYTALPTTERTGQVFGDLAATRFAGQKVGILKRDSVNWEPGVVGFKQVAAKRGVKVVLERAVAQNKGSYVQDLLDLRDAGAQLVFVWLNALETTQVVLQMKGQNWNPNVMVFPFNLVSQRVGDAALTPPLTGVGMFQAYSFGDRSGSFASYADDLNQFEQQYAKYRPDADLHGLGGDLLFLNWSAQKAFHQILLDCGRSCGRNELLKTMSTYKKRPSSSACSLDFTRPGPGNSHRGGYAVSVMEAYRAPDGNVNFRNTNTCVESL